MNWIVFSNNLTYNTRGFEYFEDETEALESMEDSLKHYEKHGVSIEMGLAEIAQIKTANISDSGQVIKYIDLV